MVAPETLVPLLGCLPALAWLIFFRLEDRLHPEPKKMVAKVFVVGMIAALAASLAEEGTQRLIMFIKAPIGPESITFFITLALIEEIIKFGAVYFTIRKNRFFDEPIDAMIYMITAALGFAALENVIFLFYAGSTGIFEVIALRSVGATLLHALASGFIGFYWAKRKLIRGVMIATLIHAGFNYLVLRFQSMPIYATAILIFASFFLFYDFDIIKENETTS